MAWLWRFVIACVFVLSGIFALWANDGVNGRTVSTVTHPGGTFVAEGGGWAEKNRSGQTTFRFDERGRDDWSVYLYDGSRDVNLQLDLHRREVLYGAGSAPLGPLYRITGASAAPATTASSPFPAEQVTGSNVGLVRHPGGSLEMQGGQWLEKDSTGRTTFRFQERGRDEWSVYLDDVSRNVKLQLDLYQKQILYGSGDGPMSPLYQITGASVAPPATPSGGGGSVNPPVIAGTPEPGGTPTVMIANNSGQSILVLVDESGAQSMLAQVGPGQTTQQQLPAGTVLAFANAAGTAFVGEPYSMTTGASQSISIPYSRAAAAPPQATGNVVRIRNASGQNILVLVDRGGAQSVAAEITAGQAANQNFPSGTKLSFANAAGSAFIGDPYVVTATTAQTITVPLSTAAPAPTGGGQTAQQQPSGTVTVHQHCDFGGYGIAIPAGRHTIGQLQAMGVGNDDVSSLRVPQGWEVTIYSDSGFQGNSRKLVSDTRCLVDAGMNDALSSIIVEARGTGVNSTGDGRVDVTLTDAQIGKVVDLLMKEFVEKQIKTQVDAQNRPLACWRDSYGRGVGKIPDCGPNQEKSGLLCYSKCNADSRRDRGANYKNVAGVCWAGCPSGYRNDGAFCRKTRMEYGRGAGYPWKFGDGLNDSGMYKRCESDHGRGKCEKNGAIVYPKCDPGYTNVGCCICTLKGGLSGGACRGVAGLRTGSALALGSCAKHSFVLAPERGGCSGSRENDAGLCYPNCKRGYSGVGPVCWASCPAHMPVNCGASCAKDKASCGMTLTDQISAPLMAAGNAAITIGTLGTGTAAAQAGKAAAAGAKAAAKVAAKAAARAAAKQALKQTVKQTLKSKVKTMAKELAKDVAIDAVAGGIITSSVWAGMNAKGKNDFKVNVENQIRQKLNEEFSDPESIEAITELVMKGVEEQQPDAEFPWESLDPTGIAEIVVAYNLPLCSKVY